MRKEHAGKVTPSMVMDMTGCDGRGDDTTAKMKGMISHTQLVAEVNPSVRDVRRASSRLVSRRRNPTPGAPTL